MSKASSLPLRFEKTAPRLANLPRGLKRYIKEVEDLCDKNNVTDDQEKKIALTRYVDDETELIWTLETTWEATKAYKDFTEALYLLYPGSKEDELYTLLDLEAVCASAAAKPLESLADLGEYERAFNLRFEWLKSKVTHAGLSDAVKSTWYLKGFDEGLSKEVLDFCRRVNPTQLRSKPFTMKEVQDGARYVLEGTSVELDSARNQGKAKTADGSPSSSAVKAEVMEPFLPILNSLNELVQGLKVVASPPQKPTPTTSAPRNDRCYFCGVGNQPGEVFHNARNCPIRADYIARGWCKLNDRGRIVLMDGSPIPRSPKGRNDKENLEHYHAQKSSGTATLTVVSNNLNIHKPSVIDQYTGTIKAQCHANVVEVSLHNTDAELREIDAAFRQAQTADELISLARRKAELNAGATRRSGDAKNGSNKEEKKPDNSGSDAHKGARPGNRQDYGEERTRYVSPIEDSRVAGKVLQKILDLSTTISIRELAAIAPDIRRNLKEQVTGKRMPVNSHDAARANYIEMLEDDATAMPTLKRAACDLTTVDHQNTLIEAEEVVDLMSIFPKIGHDQEVECLLDPGAQFVAMSSAVWHMLGLPLDPTSKIRVVSSNGTEDLSLGICRSVPFHFGGGVTLYLQCHVVHNAVYDILLGKPFDRLSSLSTKTNMDGTMHVTINDPNSGKMVTLPATPRGKPRFKWSTNVTSRELLTLKGFH